VAMRSPEPESTRPIRDLLRRLIKAPAVLSILWPAFLILGGYLAWHRWGVANVAPNFQSIDPALIQISAPPTHVRSDITAAVYRDTAMQGLSLMDRQAAAKIASAFALHPWVREVHGVRKLPGGVVDVRLEYRQPVAMVQVYRTISGRREKYFFPVDMDAVLLPTKDFTRAETAEFIHIDVPGADSSNAEGMAFGDLRVAAAAKLAAVLLPLREKIGVQTIRVVGDPRQMTVPQLELVTANQTRHYWGSPPGMELPRESSAIQKLETLMTIDLETSTDLRVARR
jgi:hypothetical protein